jgi:hypothetical protein
MSMPLYYQGNKPPIHHMGVWVCPRASLDVMKRKVFLLLPGMEPRLFSRLANSLVAIMTELTWLLIRSMGGGGGGARERW